MGGAVNRSIPPTASAVQTSFTAVSSVGADDLRASPYESAEPTATLMADNHGTSISSSVALAISDTCYLDSSVKRYRTMTPLVVEVIGCYCLAKY